MGSEKREETEDGEKAGVRKREAKQKETEAGKQQRDKEMENKWATGES